MSKWTLTSGRLSDGAEVLTLRKDGCVICEYARALEPYESYWHKYSHGFPIQEFTTRNGCIKNAEQLSGVILEVTLWEPGKY